MNDTISLNVNGQNRRVQADCNVARLLEEFKLAPVRVAVELNRELVSRREFDTTALCEGDVVEIVTLVGGG